jgi:hypothetical protein
MLDLAAVLIAVVAAAAGAGAMYLAPHVGASNPVGLALIVGGALAALFSWQQVRAGTQNRILFIPMWVFGLASIVLGIVGVGFFSNPFETKLTPEQVKKLDGITEKLRRNKTSGSSKAAAEIATSNSTNFISVCKKRGYTDKFRIYVELDGGEVKSSKALNAYVQVEGAEGLAKDARELLVSDLVQFLQQLHPTLNIRLGLRGSDRWCAVGFANAGNRHQFRDGATPDF